MKTQELIENAKKGDTHSTAYVFTKNELMRLIIAVCRKQRKECRKFIEGDLDEDLLNLATKHKMKVGAAPIPNIKID